MYKKFVTLIEFKYLFDVRTMYLHEKGVYETLIQRLYYGVEWTCRNTNKSYLFLLENVWHYVGSGSPLIIAV